MDRAILATISSMHQPISMAVVAVAVAVVVADVVVIVACCFLRLGETSLRIKLRPYGGTYGAT